MESAMSDHKFKIGQSVQYTSGPYGRGTANGVYKITQLLPSEGDDRQYRIKSAERAARAGRPGEPAREGLNEIQWSGRRPDCESVMMKFDYETPAELFMAKRKGGTRQPLGYRRFGTAAEAIRFAIEEFPAVRTLRRLAAGRRRALRRRRNSAALRQRRVSAEARAN